MDIRSLEHAIREAVQANPSQPAFATLSGKGSIRESLTGELASAIESLASRKADAISRGLLGDIMAGWH
jgi:hypothetical protein